MAAGDFTTSQVPLLQQTAADAWASSRANNSQSRFDPSTGVLDAVMANGVSANFMTYVKTPDNCLGVQIDWMEQNPTATVYSDFTDHLVVPCAVTGDQAESKSEVKKLEHDVETSFQLKEEDCQNAFTFADKYAYQSLQADRALIQAMSGHVLTRLHGFSGQNLVPAGDKNNVGTPKTGDPTVTLVNPSNTVWQDFYPYLQLVRTFNKFADPFLLDGTQFMHQRFLAAVQAGTLSDNGANGAFQLERYYSDPRTFAAAGVTGKLYYIDSGAVAFAAGGMNPLQATTYQPATGGPIIRYQEPIHGLTMPDGRPVMKDVFAQQTTIGTGRNCRLVRSFIFRLPFELFLNPKQSTDPVTGVIEIAVDATAAAKTTTP